MAAIGSALAVMFWCFVGLEAFAHMGRSSSGRSGTTRSPLLGGVLLAGLIY